jgi:FtsP/CotA-like multicopper oxidase with cupredoxin domain
MIRLIATIRARAGTALGIAAGAALLSSVLALGPPLAGAQTPLNPGLIPKFVEPLPMPLRVDATLTTPAAPLELTMNEFQQKLLPNTFYAALPAPYNAGAYLWCYKAAGLPQTFPGPTLETRVGVPTSIRYVNNLQGAGGAPPVLQSLIKVDQTLHWADPLGQHGSMNAYVGPVPAVAHLHGGEVPSSFDGGPDAWWTPNGIRGPGYVTDTYTYPNMQQATTLWYHDHALGATRLNVYAGLAGFYLLRDSASEPQNLPGGPLDTPSDQYGNLYEREVVIQDRMFDTNGQLYWPSLGINPTVHPFWGPEFFGDVIMVNGKTWPYLNVEPRRYRFRLLDGSNARFYDLRLMNRTLKTAGPAFWQIGSDGGLLNAPVVLNDPLHPASPRLIIAPGERCDIVIDFSGFAGQTLTLLNAAKAPFPKGAAADPATTAQIMQFRVGLTVTGGADPSLNPATTASLRATPIERPVAGANVRALTLNEHMGPLGPLEMFVNNTMWDMDPSEVARVGDTEVWEIINLTADTHPIHLHLVQFQLLSRQAFNVARYMAVYGMPMPGMGPPLPYDTPSAATGFKLGGNPDITPFLQGPLKAPDPNETGWKDTFRMNPGEVTRVLVRVAPQDANARAAALGVTPGPGVNLFDFEPWTPMGETDEFGYPGGPGYVWHCHIVDHEDNEMMKQFMIAGPEEPAAPVAAARAMPATVPVPVPASSGELSLASSAPNPATSQATIAFSLPRAADVSLVVFDVSGHRVRTLASGSFPAGRHAVLWSGTDDDGHPVASGTYFYRLVAPEKTLVRRMAFIR